MSLRSIVGSVETISFWLLIWNVLYIASLLSQQKPKEEKNEERKLLKQILGLAFFIPISFVIILVFSVKYGVWSNLILAFLLTTFSISIILLYPLLLIKIRKQFNKEEINKYSLINKALVAYFVVILISFAYEITKYTR